MDVSVVIPVYRNKETLRELHSRLCTVLAPYEFEIIFVNDACPDGSLPVLRTLNPALLVANSYNLGQHRSVLAGMVQAKGKIVVVMDADLQDEPETIPVLLQRLAKGGVHCVFAGRRGAYEAWHRLITSFVFKSILSYLTGVPRSAGMFFAADRQLVDRLLAYRDSDPFVVAMIGCTGLRVTSVPIRRQARHSGKSSYSSLGRLSIGWRAIKLVFRLKTR